MHTISDDHKIDTTSYLVTLFEYNLRMSYSIYFKYIISLNFFPDLHVCPPVQENLNSLEVAILSS